MKMDKDVRKMYAPVFEVNIRLRIPAESDSSESSEENLHESDKCSEKSAMCEEEISENEVSFATEHSSEELLPVTKLKKYSSNLEILSGMINKIIKSEENYPNSWRIT